jgi:hypothetical protein
MVFRHGIGSQTESSGNAKKHRRGNSVHPPSVSVPSLDALCLTNEDFARLVLPMRLLRIAVDSQLEENRASHALTGFCGGLSRIPTRTGFSDRPGPVLGSLRLSGYQSRDPVWHLLIVDEQRGDEAINLNHPHKSTVLTNLAFAGCLTSQGLRTLVFTFRHRRPDRSFSWSATRFLVRSR